MASSEPLFTPDEKRRIEKMRTSLGCKMSFLVHFAMIQALTEWEGLTREQDAINAYYAHLNERGEQ